MKSKYIKDNGMHINVHYAYIWILNDVETAIRSGQGLIDGLIHEKQKEIEDAQS